MGILQVGSDLDTLWAVMSKIRVILDAYTMPTEELLSQAKVVGIYTLNLKSKPRKACDTISNCLVLFKRRNVLCSYLPVEDLFEKNCYTSFVCVFKMVMPIYYFGICILVFPSLCFMPLLIAILSNKMPLCYKSLNICCS